MCGLSLIHILKQQEGARVVAVYDPENAGTVAAELGCDTETDLDRLYSREDVDAVIVASPNYLHKEPVIKAAEHGVHVFCEKPIALSYQDSRIFTQSSEAAAFSGRWYYSGFQAEQLCVHLSLSLIHI